jgi:GT2 family glycosyltransferase
MIILTASIVLYKNPHSQITKVVNSFLLSSNCPDQLIIVDNSPTDLLNDLPYNPRVVYIHNPSNPGFGAAHNIAIKESIAIGACYHLVLNPDIYFDQETIPDLINFMDLNPDIGNVMPKVFYPDGSIQYLCKLLPTPYDWIGRRFNPIRSMVEKRNQIFELKFTSYNKLMDVPYLSGCFMFLRTSALLKVGLFDENIFMYGEETDLCRRLNSAGYRTVYNPEVSIIHEFQKGSHNSLRLTWIGIKSAFYYFNKWGWIYDKQRKLINNKVINNLKIH